METIVSWQLLRKWRCCTGLCLSHARYAELRNLFSPLWVYGQTADHGYRRHWRSQQAARHHVWIVLPCIRLHHSEAMVMMERNLHEQGLQHRSQAN